MPSLKSLVSTLPVAMFLLVSTAVVADDEAAPGWLRGGPFTTVQEWDFDTPGMIAPDGDEIATFSPGIPMVTPGSGLTYSGLADLPVGATGYLGALPFGGTLFFDIPNVPDLHPVKHLQIQINGLWPVGFEPFVTSVTGTILPDTTVPGVFVDSEETFPGFHRAEDWDMFPNPDFEELALFIPAGVFVNQVVIDTISAIPVPAALPLLLSSLALLGGLSGKRQRTMH